MSCWYNSVCSIFSSSIVFYWFWILPTCISKTRLSDTLILKKKNPKSQKTITWIHFLVNIDNELLRDSEIYFAATHSKHLFLDFICNSLDLMTDDWCFWSDRVVLKFLLDWLDRCFHSVEACNVYLWGHPVVLQW